MGLKRPTSGSSSVTELTVIDGATIDSTTLVVDDDNNRVGIGTATPTATLDIDGDIQLTPTAISTAHVKTTGSLDVRCTNNLKLGTDGADSVRIGRINSTGAKIHLRSGADTDLVVTNSKVGIGTETPKTDLTIEGTITLKEQAAADGDTAAYGQLWVKTATPNELYFTTDAGDDIQITSGTSLSESGDITGVTAGTGLSGGGTSGALTVNLDTNSLTEAAIANGDYLVFNDATDSNAPKREALADVVSLIAGTASSTGLSASSSVLSVSDLHPVGVDGAANQLLTDDGDGTVSSEGNLSFDGSTLAVTGALTTTTTATIGTDLTVTGGDITFGAGQDASLIVADTAHNVAGKPLTVASGTTTAGTTNNIAGGDLILQGGPGKGSGVGGKIIFQTANAGGSGSSLNSQATALTIDDDLSATFAGAIQANSTVTVGVDDTGYDVKLFGATASAYMLWDASEDDLILGGAARAVIPDGQLVLGSTAVSSTAAELNVLDGLNRGHIIVGNSSNVPYSLAEGSENQVLTIDSNGDAVWANAAGGASVLDDLSDASFSSGDLTITALDTLTTSASAHNAAGTAVKIQAGTTTAGTTNNIAGGALTLAGGQGKGSGAGGDIIFQVANAGGSGSSLNSLATALTISDDKSATFEGDVTFSTNVFAGKFCSHAGDTNTRIVFLDAGDIMAFEAGGVEMIRLTEGTQDEVVFNEASGDVDIRMESDDETHMFFIDSDANRISIGDSTDAPAATLEITNHASAGATGVPLIQLNSNDTDQIGLDFNAANVDADVIDITADAVTTAHVFDVTADALTTGSILNLVSDSSTTGVRALVNIVNDHASAVNTTALLIRNDAIAAKSTVVIESTAAETNPLLELINGNAATDKPPILRFNRLDDTAEADDMSLGQIDFYGVDAGNNPTEYASIKAYATDINAGDESGELEFNVSVSKGGSASAVVTAFKVGREDLGGTPDDPVAIFLNPGSEDLDVIMHGDAQTNVFRLQASSDNIGIGGRPTEVTAFLQIVSTTKGFLPSKMNTTQQNAISSPAAGLMLYNTSTNKLMVYNGSAWTALH